MGVKLSHDGATDDTENVPRNPRNHCLCNRNNSKSIFKCKEATHKVQATNTKHSTWMRAAPASVATWHAMYMWQEVILYHEIIHWPMTYDIPHAFFLFCIAMRRGRNTGHLPMPRDVTFFLFFSFLCFLLIPSTRWQAATRLPKTKTWPPILSQNARLALPGYVSLTIAALQPTISKCLVIPWVTISRYGFSSSADHHTRHELILLSFRMSQANWEIYWQNGLRSWPILLVSLFIIEWELARY